MSKRSMNRMLGNDMEKYFHLIDLHGLILTFMKNCENLENSVNHRKV